MEKVKKIIEHRYSPIVVYVKIYFMLIFNCKGLKIYC